MDGPWPYGWLNRKDDDFLFDNPNSVASANESTGLVQAPPVTDSAAESYSEIYDVPVEKDPDTVRTTTKNPDWEKGSKKRKDRDIHFTQLD